MNRFPFITKWSIPILCVCYSTFTYSQNHPACDSLVIDCCEIYAEDDNFLTLYASNNNLANELFGYPSFILINDEGDTIAQEVVNYFGIGGGPQEHLLTLQEPFVLPFSGTLELYVGFMDSLYCTFPITINDGTNSSGLTLSQETIHIYPNPANDLIWVDKKLLPKENDYTLGIYSMDGKLVQQQSLTEDIMTIPLENLSGTVYIIIVEDQDKNIIAKKKIISK